MQYDDCLDASKIIQETTSLEKFLDVVITPVVAKKTKEQSEDYKSLYVHFRNIEDFTSFCKKINQVIDYKTKETYFPLANLSTSLFDDEHVITEIDEDLLTPRKTKKVSSNTVVADEYWRKHWKNMPDFVQEENKSFRSVTIRFRTETDYNKFSKIIEQELSSDAKSIWYPELNNEPNRFFRWVQDVPSVNKYPVYVISKNRSSTMYTSRSLNDMGVYHFIAVEPQDLASYAAALDYFSITTATLIELPFSNHGKGSGPARNFCWEHSIEAGHKRHWILDDNIQDFYRLHENNRYRVKTPVFFRVMEDFVDRYKNIRLAGPRYRFFCSSDQKYPAFIKNTHIMSCILIDNSLDIRWRSKYNEDIDLSLRVLKDGGCTVLFNAFLQGKCATQTVKGGNTEEVYNADKTDYTDTTYEKTITLVNLHPELVTAVERYGRWHHHVDYSSFDINDIVLNDDVCLSDEINNYNMKLLKLEELEAK